MCVDVNLCPLEVGSKESGNMWLILVPWLWKTSSNFIYCVSTINQTYIKSTALIIWFIHLLTYTPVVHVSLMYVFIHPIVYSSICESVHIYSCAHSLIFIHSSTSLLSHLPLIHWPNCLSSLSTLLELLLIFKLLNFLSQRILTLLYINFKLVSL